MFFRPPICGGKKLMKKPTVIQLRNLHDPKILTASFGSNFVSNRENNLTYTKITRIFRARQRLEKLLHALVP